MSWNRILLYLQFRQKSNRGEGRGKHGNIHVYGQNSAKGNARARPGLPVLAALSLCVLSCPVLLLQLLSTTTHNPEPDTSPPRPSPPKPSLHQTPIPPPASDSLVRLTSSTPPPSPSAPVKLTSPNARVPHLSSLRAVKIINNSPATTQPRRSHPPLRSAPSQTRHRVDPYPSHPSPPALKHPPSPRASESPGANARKKHVRPAIPQTDSAR
jgi:hypothetical protein